MRKAVQMPLDERSRSEDRVSVDEADRRGPCAARRRHGRRVAHPPRESMAECERRSRPTSRPRAVRMGGTIRLRAETIDRALRHDLVLFGEDQFASELVFTGGPRGERSACAATTTRCAIDWMAASLVDGVDEQDTKARRRCQNQSRSAIKVPVTSERSESNLSGRGTVSAKIPREFSTEPPVERPCSASSTLPQEHRRLRRGRRPPRQST